MEFLYNLWSPHRQGTLTALRCGAPPFGGSPVCGAPRRRPEGSAQEGTFLVPPTELIRLLRAEEYRNASRAAGGCLPILCRIACVSMSDTKACNPPDRLGLSQIARLGYQAIFYLAAHGVLGLGTSHRTLNKLPHTKQATAH